MEHIFRMCYYGGLICAVFLFVLAIFLFVKLNIPKVFGELTGKTEKKSINGVDAGIRSACVVRKGEQDKYYRGTSEKIKARKSKTDEFENESDTSVLSEGGNDKETDVLSEFDNEGKTSVLSAGLEEETQVLLEENEETSVLNDNTDEETSVLNTNTEEETLVLSTNIEEETSVLNTNAEEETSILVAGEVVATKVFGSDDDVNIDATEEITQSVNKLEGKAKIYYDVVVVHTNESL